MNLDHLDSRILSCQLCDLAIGRTKAVPGEGPCPSKIMLVGEAPGAEEDITGRPFVGRAGHLLDRSLDLAGIKRSEVFITSVVKCRPPANRKPKIIEIKSCHPYLQSQIDLIHPRVVGLMGNVAAKALLNMHGVTSLHGQVFEGRFLVTFHPAAVLRNINLKGDFVSDLKKINEMGSPVKDYSPSSPFREGP
jgi:uracil-DNA glycosylase family 4